MFVVFQSPSSWFFKAHCSPEAGWKNVRKNKKIDEMWEDHRNMCVCGCVYVERETNVESNLIKPNIFWLSFYWITFQLISLIIRVNTNNSVTNEFCKLFTWFFTSFLFASFQFVCIFVSFEWNEIDIFLFS